MFKIANCCSRFTVMRDCCSAKHLPCVLHCVHLNNVRVRFIRNASTANGEQFKDESHNPVMVQEVLEHLNPSAGKTYIDMTFGSGGHSTKILESVPDVTIYALDRDPAAYNLACDLEKKYPKQVIPLLGRFSDLPDLLVKREVSKNSIDGFLFEFGCSSMQLGMGNRGFSIWNNGPLDMRMDGDRFALQPTAADVLEAAEEHDLARLIKVYGQEKRAKKIARGIVESKYLFRSLQSTHELAGLVESIINGIKPDKLNTVTIDDGQGHCATKTFQALRIFVNNELNEINYAMVLAAHYLKLHGRVITISFNNLEDTIVKRHITGTVDHNLASALPLKYVDLSETPSQAEIGRVAYTPWKMLHKHVLLPDSEEVKFNLRSRNAKFRAIEKVK